MADIGTLSPEQMLQQQQNLRNLKMSEMLVQQGMQQPQSQMVGGRYVAPSIFQNIAGLANQYVGQRGIEKADQANLNLARQLRQQGVQDTERLMNVFGGRPAIAGTPDVPTETYETVRGTPAQPAIAPNPRLAFAEALNMQSPQARALLPQIAAEAFKKPERFIVPEGGKALMANPDGTVTEIATGGEKTSNDYKDYLKAIKDPINPFKGGFTDYQLMTNRSKAPTTLVNTSNKFASGFASKASEGAYGMYEQALAAPQAIENAKRTIELVNSGALTGPAANIGLEAAKIFNVAGANNQDTISKTEQLFSNRGKAMLGSIKQSGLAGSQGLTEGERKFLTQAEGGTITLNAETLKAMAGLEIKMAVGNQKKWNAQASKMDKEILNATGAGPVEVYTGIGTIDTSNPLLAPRR
jgi:hypothetical protein